QWGGYVLLVSIVFAETGLLIGCFLPGDSLLITAGLLPPAGPLNIWWINRLPIPPPLIGGSVGHSLPAPPGPRIFTRPNSLLFNPQLVLRTRHFYERYGPKTIVIARFVPIIRPFAPVLAGVGMMEYRRFLTYNVLGGIGWVVSMSWAGYLLGQAVPNISRH